MVPSTGAGDEEDVPVKEQLHVSKGVSFIALMARGVSEDGEKVTDFRSQLAPGQSAFGRTYEEWLNGPDSVDIYSLTDISPKSKSTK